MKKVVSTKTVTRQKQDVKVENVLIDGSSKKKKRIFKIVKLFSSNLEYCEFEPVKPWTL